MFSIVVKKLNIQLSVYLSIYLSIYLCIYLFTIPTFCYASYLTWLSYLPDYIYNPCLHKLHHNHFNLLPMSSSPIALPCPSIHPSKSMLEYRAVIISW